MKKFLIALVAFSISIMAFAEEPTVDGTRDGSYQEYGTMSNGGGTGKLDLATAYVYLTFDHLYVYVEAVSTATIIEGVDSENNFVRSFITVVKNNPNANDEKVVETIYLDTDGVTSTLDNNGKYYEMKIPVELLGADYDGFQIHANFSDTRDNGSQTGTVSGSVPVPVDPNDPKEPGIPLDGGLGILALVGLGFGVYKRRH